MLRRLLLLLLAGVAAVALAACGTQSPHQPSEPSYTETLEFERSVQDLPPEARETLALIDRGGPFPYRQDGSTFGNFEGLLPEQPRGYYKEYTVETPGLSHRGARRIVVGAAGEYYWTEDHYESFERISR